MYKGKQGVRRLAIPLGRTIHSVKVADEEIIFCELDASRIERVYFRAGIMQSRIIRPRRWLPYLIERAQAQLLDHRHPCAYSLPRGKSAREG